MNPKGTKITFQQRLDESFQKFPHHIAIESGAYHITYSQLENKANCICNWIKHKGIAPESFMGICFDHPMDIIPVMVGILKARCVFVIMDTSLPRQRLLNLARITHLHIIFTCTKNKNLFENNNETNISDFKEPIDAIIVDEAFYQNSHVSSSSREPQIREYNREDKIYIYFTSGSTGIPKAIIGKNKSLLHYIEWEIETFKIDKTFRFSQWITPGFDAFLRDVFTPLCAGAVICIPPRKVMEMAGHELIHWLNARHIGLIHCVPSVFRLINIFNEKEAAKENFKTLKMVVMAGEKIIPQELKRWFETFAERIQLINLYGLTETTMTKTCYFIQPADADRPIVPVGKAIPGARVLILDENMQACPKKFIGEIYIRTPFGTHRYYNDPQANKEKFIPNPFTQDPNDLLHKTGDLGRLLDDDNIEVLRRVDRQIKIRGVRVEPEEIENILLQHPNMAEVSVIGKKNKTGELFLCAYFVPRPLHSEKESMKIITGAELGDYLAMHLPSYMVPSFFIPLEKMPLTSNGKIDRSALPEPPQEQDQYRPPTNEAEKKLADIWSQVLNTDKDKIGIDANFFRMGGHSLNAAILMSRIHNQLGIKIPLAEIFNNPTIRSLAAYMNTSMSAKNTFLAIEPVEKKEYYPLSSAQKRLYFLQQWDPLSIAYNMPMIQALGNSIDLQALEAAMNKLIARHETMRTSFIQLVDIPFQKVHDPAPFKIEYYDLATEGTEKTEENIHQLIQSFIRPFDLSQAPLLRCALIRRDNDHHIWLVDIHHIVTDGTSQAILIEDFFNISQGKELAPLRLQYKDFSQWQNQLFESGAVNAQQEYWLSQLSGEIPRLNLPADYKRPTRFTFAGTNHSFILEAEETLAFRQLGNKPGATLYMNILAVLNVLFYKYTGQTDIIIGSGIAGRPHADLQEIVGMFVNILVMRNYPCREKSYEYFLNEVSRNSIKNFENQDVQFEDLVEKINPARDPSRNPVFDVAMMVQNFMEIKKSQGEPTAAPPSPVQYKRTTTKSDLTFFVNEMADYIRITIEYYTGIFKEETIHRLAAHFKAVIKNVIENPSILLEDIDILSEKEKQQILLEFNDTERDYPKPKTIHQLFEEQVEKIPDYVGLVGLVGDVGHVGPVRPVRQITITYSQLNGHSNQLAGILIEKGVLPDTIVGIMMERSIEMIIAILGILKSGGAYLPIDPEYPEERIVYMLKDSGAAILLTDYEKKIIVNCQLLIVNCELLSMPQAPLQHPSSFILIPSNLAYIIYTSGTTGKAKGVAVTHSGVVNCIYWRLSAYGFNEMDVTLQLLSYVFDGFGVNLYSSLLSGGKLVIIHLLDFDYIPKLVTTSKVTNTSVTPGIYELLLDNSSSEQLKSLRFIVLAGEKSSAALIMKSREKAPWV
jgi:amino acid adenylation domain-containing protein